MVYHNGLSLGKEVFFIGFWNHIGSVPYTTDMYYSLVIVYSLEMPWQTALRVPAESSFKYPVVTQSTY
jgi:hypothetical protein